MRAIILTLSLLIAGCSTMSKINKLQGGMTPEQVDEIMGEPVRIDKVDGRDCRIYELTNYGDWTKELWAVSFDERGATGHMLMATQDIPNVPVAPLQGVVSGIYTPRQSPQQGSGRQCTSGTDCYVGEVCQLASNHNGEIEGRCVRQ